METGRSRKRTTGAAQNRVAMGVIIFAACVLFLVLLVQSHLLSEKVSANEQKLAEIETQIEAENRRTEEISELGEYMQSDEYLEKVAKDKLGLVGEDEILFKESD